ncbi:DUF3093 domain-containing protein [Mycetocola manganoxydans]|uniref:DUF3093 domain-containing protein n=1 Tax=Mycetocola manganoxydans TaxID=699879 RepID=A0A3L6ZXS4_9MICO|nr:DUF3093 domain-containing protein [Mycetocola manganoxydans]RLP72584.1 DUF3093 domain-containing protein [Mycetocola manganoxydans]GHD39673.1 membrane protein [Mycetocola manganoxydans]
MTRYRERLWPAPWLLIAAALVIPASMLVLAPISLLAGIVTAVILYAGCVALFVLGAPTIEVGERMLRAGRARIPLELIGSSQAFSGEEARQERGPRLDARAWLMIRGSIDAVVRVELNDPADPTPYWLVSTRHPTELAAAIQGSRRPADASGNR